MSVTSTESGKITKVFAQEEDNVTVGNDLFEVEAGEPPAGKGNIYLIFFCLYSKCQLLRRIRKAKTI